jgi:hypothetical protein
VAAEFGVSRATAKRSARELASTLTPVTEGAEALNVEGIIGEGLTAHSEALREMTELLHHEGPSVRQGTGGLRQPLRQPARTPGPLVPGRRLHAGGTP